MSQPQTAAKGEKKSALAALIEARPKVYYDFPVAETLGFLPGVGEGKSTLAIKYRVATKAEQDAAIADAYRYVKERTGEVEEAAKDGDILTDAKNAAILAIVCRSTEDPDNLPAFPHCRWVTKNLNTYQIAGLINGYGDALRKSGAVREEVSDEVIETAASVVAGFEYEAARRWLTTTSREWLVDMVIGLSRKLEVSRIEIAGFEAEVGAAMERAAEGAAPTELAPATSPELADAKGE